MVDYAKYGYAFENNLKKGLSERKFNHGDVFFFKIPDARMLSKKDESFAKGEKVPADFFIMIHGTPILLECKSTKNKRFLSTMIAEHQLFYLNDIYKYGGEGYFAIEHRVQRKSVMYIIDARYLWNNPKPSYTWEEIEKESVYTVSKKKGMYKVDKWVEDYDN